VSELERLTRVVTASEWLSKRQQVEERENDTKEKEKEQEVMKKGGSGQQRSWRLQKEISQLLRRTGGPARDGLSPRRKSRKSRRRRRRMSRCYLMSSRRYSMRFFDSSKY